MGAPDCFRQRCSVAIVDLTTRFTELAGCEVPIQQAPMGSVSTSALAVAVADAGGVGSITAMGLGAGENLVEFPGTQPHGSDASDAARIGSITAMGLGAGELDKVLAGMTAR